jgi:hypothetical protein
MLKHDYVAPGVAARLLAFYFLSAPKMLEVV